MSKLRRLRHIGSALALVLLASAGCESRGPETTPMDQPLDQNAAMEVDQRMQQGTDEFIKKEEETKRK